MRRNDSNKSRYDAVDEDTVDRMMNELNSDMDDDDDEIPSNDDMKVEEEYHPTLKGFRKFKYKIAGFIKKAAGFLNRVLPFGKKATQYAHDFAEAYQTHLEDEAISEENAIDLSQNDDDTFNCGFKKYTMKDEIVDFFKGVWFNIKDFFETIVEKVTDFFKNGIHFPDPKTFFAPAF